MKMRVMVAGCDDWLQVTARQYLERSGCQVVTADDALDCIEKVLANPPDVIVVQDGLLWGNSDGLLERLRDEPDVAGKPVLLILDESSGEDISQISKAPVVACLRRPFPMSELLPRLTSLASDGVARDGAAAAPQQRDFSTSSKTTNEGEQT